MSRWWRTLRVAWWLGWQIESNWTDPFLFFVYSLARPLAGAMIVAVMYLVVARGRGGEVLGFFVLGSAFWPLVLAGVEGMTLAIITDREHWRTIRDVYIARAPYPAYLAGRALAQQATALAAVVVTCAVGRLALGVPVPQGARPLYGAAAFAMGLVASLAVGLLVVSVAMSSSGEAWRLPEAVSAALYLLCGAIFPVAVLPWPLRRLAEAIPLTWWLDALRRAALEGVPRSVAWAEDGTVLGMLALTTVAWLGAAAASYVWAERRARALGILDAETAF